MENYQEINKRAGLNKRAGRENELDTQLVISSISVVKINLYLIKLIVDKKKTFLLPKHIYSYQTIGSNRICVFLFQKYKCPSSLSEKQNFQYFCLAIKQVGFYFFCKFNKRAGLNNRAGSIFFGK